MALEERVDLEKIAKITPRLTRADLAGVCMKAGLLALRENAEAKGISMEHFLRAVKNTTPSVTEQVEEEYAKLAQRIREDVGRIGFRPPARRERGA